MTDQVTITHTPDTTAQEAHEAAMVAKVDGQQAPAAAPEADPAATPERPSWLPEKFKSVEDMAKAYEELEKKQGTKPADPPADPAADPADPAAADAAAKELEAKGLDLNEFSTEFSQKGELSTESYDKLAKAGYPKALVDQYIEGQRALGAAYETELKAVVGGDEKFTEIATWASESLTEAEKVAYNKAIDSGDKAQAQLALQGLAAKYAEANPTEGNLLAGRVSNAVGDKYESTAQITADMGNPLYKSDPAFRAKVAAKIARSNVI